MNRWVGLLWKHGGWLLRDPVAEQWAISLTSRDPSIPGLALESLPASGTTGQVSVTLGGATVAATAGVAVAGVAEIAAGPAVLSATAGVAVAGEMSVTLAGASVAASGTTEEPSGEESFWLAGRVAGKVAARNAARQIAA
jgi:hypothetical protein